MNVHEMQSLNYFELRLQGPRAAETLQDRDDVSRRGTDGGESTHQLFYRGSLFENHVTRLFFLDTDRNLRDHFGCPGRQWVGLRNIVSGLDLNRQVAMHDGDW